MNQNKLKKVANHMSRADKIKFLMNHKIFDLNTLLEKKEKDLNELTVICLDATGLDFKDTKTFF